MPTRLDIQSAITHIMSVYLQTRDLDADHVPTLLHAIGRVLTDG
jgi:hypothetical protein